MGYSVAIAGASGYVGGELLRLIAQHPQLELKTVTANTNVGETVATLHPHLVQFADQRFVPTDAEHLSGHDIVFLALPHAKSAEVAAYLDDSTLFLDCGADFRLESESDWVKFYGGTHAGTWAYGMPELLVEAGSSKQRKNLSGVLRIAVPGCNVTAISLALAPGLAAKVIEPTDIVSVLSVGTSGAGRTLKTNLLASEILGSASAYGVGGSHRHTPEIEQNLRKAFGGEVQVNFTPVLVPMSRGILAVNTAKLAPGVTAKQVRDAYLAAYSGETFVKVLDEGQYPATASTLGVNTCLIGLTIDEHAGRVIVVSAIDNLVKGTAGAAIQSLNLALGIPEETGLGVNGVAP
ncbi:MAG: putative N-acetyl-gamma-glutamyl-phosphate reductase [Actinomycetota bacterium]